MANYIDEKFKDLPPEKTVEKIQTILQSLNLEVDEIWFDTGVDNCYSLVVRTKDGYAASNGKGVTKALARASAYAEFIERLQQGLHYYKLQSFIQDPDMNFHSFAPDAKYMTEQELIDNSEWMDYLIDSYGSQLTRKKIAQHCKTYASTEEDRILTIPYYSIFEDKYVFLPAGFVDQMYNTNGCCAGNTQEEAIVHAISEIFERKCKLDILTKGIVPPAIPEYILAKFPTVMHILDQIKSNDDYDIAILDISNGNGLPVVATRLINKTKHSYIINGAADPVLEIAVQRTLTELFQGRNINDIQAQHRSVIINNINDVSLSCNTWNAIESSNGLYTADFFANELQPSREFMEFNDNKDKTNRELLGYVISLCKQLNKPVYIRNYSYLGFICYKVIIPGFSEIAWPQLLTPIDEYAIGNNLRKTILNIKSANNAQLILLLQYRNLFSGKTGKVNNFSRISGLPLRGEPNITLPAITFAYASYRLNRLQETKQYVSLLANSNLNDTFLREYMFCVDLYLDLLNKSIDSKKIHSIIYKFNSKKHADLLYHQLDCGETPFDTLLLECNLTNCSKCKFNATCSYQREKEIISKVGTRYAKFTDGQSKQYFPVATI